MPKNIVILLDGTANEIKSDRSNILRLYGVLEKSDRQIVYYDPGVGTFGSENAWSQHYRKALQVWGQATGWGLDQNVKEAYRFLLQHYDDGAKGKARPKIEARDRIYIFGFSRGAYTARVLAGFIHAFGLVRPTNLNLLDYAYRAYKGIGQRSGNDPAEGDEDDRNAAFAEIRLFERILQPDRPPIRALGLFDTVPSVIEAGRILPRLRSHAYTRTNRSVEAVRHAVAIDERRTMFRPQLWTLGQDYWGNPFNKSAARPQDAREVWFTGVHGDVGGGYPEPASALAKIPLKWMIDETGPMGLHYSKAVVDSLVLGRNPKKPYVKPDPDAPMNRSMNWAWGAVEFIPRRRKKTEGQSGDGPGFYIPNFSRREIPAGASVHRSVVDRAKKAGAALPENLPVDHVVVG